MKCFGADRTHLMYREQVDDKRVLHAGEGVDLRLDDYDRLLLEDGGLSQDLHLCQFVRCGTSAGI